MVRFKLKYLIWNDYNKAARILDSYQIAFLIPTQVTDVTVEVVEGDARNVMCEAVEKHHASILVVGSHGYGAIRRYSPHPIFPKLHT